MNVNHFHYSYALLRVYCSFIKKESCELSMQVTPYWQFTLWLRVVCWFPSILSLRCIWWNDSTTLGSFGSMQVRKQTQRLKPSLESETSKPNAYINDTLEPTATQSEERKKMELWNRLLACKDGTGHTVLYIQSLYTVCSTFKPSDPLCWYIGCAQEFLTENKSTVMDIDWWCFNSRFVNK